jgi:HNH endonuclease
MELENLVGQTFGKYTVISQATSKDWKRRWLCRCSCGETRTISTEHLKSGKRTGCNSCNNGNIGRPFEGRYNTLKTQAKGRTEVELSYEEYLFFVGNLCRYCDAGLEWSPHGSIKSGHHLDRKDNSKGYSIENCVACCGECNRIKSNRYTYEQMLELGKVLKKLLRENLLKGEQCHKQVQN